MAEFNDEIGPEMIVHVYDPKTKMRGVVVVEAAERSGSLERVATPCPWERPPCGSRRKIRGHRWG